MKYLGNTFSYLLDEANGNGEYLMWMLDMNTKPKFLWKNIRYVCTEFIITHAGMEKVAKQK